MATQLFSDRFVQLLPVVFKAQAAFTGVFGDLQAVDGVSDSDTAMRVKTNDLPVVLGTYSTDPNVAFGTGTANSSRFGQMTEVIYKDVAVPYSDPWALHRGLDRFTVNADLDSAVSTELERAAQAEVRALNAQLGAYLVSKAASDLGSADDVVALFDKADEQMTELEVNVPVSAYVAPDVYNKIVDNTLTTTGKRSSVNIDTNGVVEFKGFKVYKVASKYLGKAKAIFAPDGIGRAFAGISTLRAIEAIDFDGIELQGAGKVGQYISDENLKAVFTAGASSN
uniref:Major capsid protein n=1 Tax=Siphoviridae sp. ctcPV5 TaxID=2827582 RepID=A0A8S5LKM1_9CAUD|nr:MAG TPA: major capsid protein [Siphoviridae sp. ctcPV5]